MYKRIRFLFNILALTMIFSLSGIPAGFINSSCHAQSQFADTYNDSDQWLIYWYLCGTDLETEDCHATDDLIEMTNVNLPPNVKVLIQTGGTFEWRNDTIANDCIGRYLYDENGIQELELLTDADMGKCETLTDFIRYGEENFAPDHKAFIFWNHGGGSVAGVCFDEISGNSLSLNEIRKAFTSVYNPAPENPPFELVGFDACLMASYDTANMLHGISRYMTASEELEPGVGWKYDGWLGALANNPAMGGAALGQAICDSYMDGCRLDDSEDDATLSVIDLSRIPELRSAYEAFGTEALRHSANDPNGFFTIWSRNASNAENYGGNTREQGYTNMVDIGDLARKSQILLPQTSQRLINAADNAVIYKVCGKYRNQGCGISGFYSYDCDTDNFKGYASVDSAPLSIKCLFYYLIYGDIPDEGKALLNGVIPDSAAPTNVNSSYTATDKLFDISYLDDTPVVVNKDGYAFVKLTSKEMDMLSAIHCQLLYIDPEADIIIDLGTDADIDADWDNGLFKDNFRGVWPMLDGHPIYIEIKAETDDYNLYSVPIKLNGIPCNLQVVYSFATEDYTILGARKGLSDIGMGDKNLIKLKSGDKITTIHNAMTYSKDDEDFTTLDAETFTIGANPKIEDVELPDGQYGYFFEFVTPSNDSAYSSYVEFTIDGDSITADTYE